MTVKLISVRLLVDNFAESFRFYRTTLGLAVAWGDEEGPYAEFTAADQVTIALFDRNIMKGLLAQEANESDSTDRFSLIFQTENLDNQFKQLSEAGARPLIKPTDREAWGVRTAHFRDPAANLVEINRGLDKP
jgi:catechol 2,3-dioxygenase-like lactoylglutathione lyase family enzyme